MLPFNPGEDAEHRAQLEHFHVETAVRATGPLQDNRVRDTISGNISTRLDERRAVPAATDLEHVASSLVNPLTVTQDLDAPFANVWPPRSNLVFADRRAARQISDRHRVRRCR
jgi:hypothetical protein